MILFQICLLVFIALPTVILAFLFVNISNIFYILHLLILISEVCLSAMRLILFLLVFTHGVMFPCVFCFVSFLSKTAYSLELYPRELFEGRVGDDFLQKGFVSDELLGARLSKDLFKVRSQLEVLWTSQVVKI